MQIALHNLATAYSNLLTGIRVAKETGYAGIEIDFHKLNRYLAAGYSAESLRPHFDEVPPVGLSYVHDIERQAPSEYQALMDQCQAVCSLAERIGCTMVQLLTGPLDPSGPYKGL